MNPTLGLTRLPPEILDKLQAMSRRVNRILWIRGLLVTTAVALLSPSKMNTCRPPRSMRGMYRFPSMACTRAACAAAMGLSVRPCSHMPLPISALSGTYGLGYACMRHGSACS